MKLRVLHNLLCLFVVAVLVAATPLNAFAAIQGSDYVGSTSVADRGLTITEAPAIEAAYGILVDSEGTVLWARGADEHSAMASTTKIMTAVVALENANLQDSFRVSVNASSVGESSAGLQTGDMVDLYQLLCGLLVHSGNDAGVAIAEGVCGSVSSFVDKMNEKAAELGLKDTHYTNPHGLDEDGHYSSANDLCTLSRYAMRNETFREIVGLKKVTVKYNGRKQTFKSTNSLLNTWDKCIGVKTGYTTDAGYCLVSAAVQDGVELYAVVLGCANEAQRFTDSYKLFTWGFSHYRSYELASADQVLVDVPMSGYMSRTVQAGVSETASAMVLDYDGDISVDVRLVDLPDGVAEGDVVGSITWRQGELVVQSAPLVAKESIGAPLAGMTVLVSLMRLIGFFSGDKCIAESVLHTSAIEVTRNDDLAGDAIDSKLEEKMSKDAISG